MRWMSFFAGWTIVAITGLTANGQSRIYSAGSSGPSRPAFNDNSGSRGMVLGGGSNERGMVINASRSGASMNPRGPAPSAPAPASTGASFNRPTFITINPERERELQRQRDCRRPRVGIPEVLPIYYPYYVNPPYDSTTYSDQQQQPAPEQVAEPETPAPTIFENRPGYRPPPVQSYQPISAPASQTSSNQPADNENLQNQQGTSAVEPQPTTILVFRDGHQLEIGNYAIVGDTLYNMAGGHGTHKILLADLDLDKTVKVNQERGYDFRLPKRAS